jgi:lipopolysaccharide biosynthesis glycosyltransferase
MKKNLIFTLAIGNYSRYPTIKLMEDYAKKCGADYLPLKHTVINQSNLFFEKFFFVELLERYDRVFYVDGDVLVTPHAKNVFEEFPDEECFYAFAENDHGQWMDRDYCVNPLLDDCPEWPLQENGKKQYFNAGVFLVSKPLQKYFLNFRNVPNIPGIYEFGDQTYLNYIIAKNKIKFESLPHSFNRMNLGKNDPNNERYDSNFIHYAGPDLYGNGNRDLTIQNDINYLYKKNEIKS